jgi:hypothetical protein
VKGRRRRRSGADAGQCAGQAVAQPHDAEALVEAGNAAMDMGDSNAAAGFYARAEKASPGNPRVAAALAAGCAPMIPSAPFPV